MNISTSRVSPAPDASGSVIRTSSPKIRTYHRAQAPVGQQHTILGHHQNVFRLNVAVHVACTVRMQHGVDELHGGGVVRLEHSAPI